MPFWALFKFYFLIRIEKNEKRFFLIEWKRYLQPKKKKKKRKLGGGGVGNNVVLLPTEKQNKKPHSHPPTWYPILTNFWEKIKGLRDWLREKSNKINK